jgi:hypothetical protein
MVNKKNTLKDLQKVTGAMKIEQQFDLIVTAIEDLPTKYQDDVTEEDADNLICLLDEAQFRYEKWKENNERKVIEVPPAYA